MTGDLFKPFVRNLERLVSPLGRDELSAMLAACSRISDFPAKSDLVTDGETPKASNVLLEGIVARYRVTAKGKRQILSFQVPGDMFDAQSFILRRMDHSIGALSKGRIGIFPHSELLRITDEFPRLGRAIWRGTLIDAAIHREWMVRNGQFEAIAQIAHLICEMATRLEAVELTDGSSFAWPLTQTDIGDALGLSYVHVNRCVQKLRERNLISLTRGRMEIHNIDILKDLASFDPEYLHLRAGSE